MKKYFIIIVIFSLLFIGFKFSFAQYQITTEFNNFFTNVCPYRTNINLGNINKFDYYIPQFYYYHFQNFNDYWDFLINNPDAPYKDYASDTPYCNSWGCYNCVPFFGLSGNLTLQKLNWLYDDNTLIYLIDNTLQTINKIYVFKATTTLTDGNWSAIIQADKDNDLITTLDNLNFTYDANTGAYRYFGQVQLIQKSLNNIPYNGTPNIYGQLYPYWSLTIPNQMIVLIAEGLDNNNNVVRKLVKSITVGVDNFFEIIASTPLYITLDYPVGSLNPDNYNNILRFSLYTPNYSLYQFYLEIIDNNTGKTLYTSNLYNINNYSQNGNEITLDLYNNYNFNLKSVLQNIRNQAYNNIQINLYVKVVDNNNNQYLLSSASSLELVGGVIPSPESFNYKNWYNNIIGDFGLSNATPTSIFIKAGEFIDNLFNVSLLPTFDIEDKGKELANKFNTFLSYMKAIPFVSTLILVVLGFFAFRFAYKFLKYIFLR
jgi:hypothetical protein